ncbi:MAG: hypothetical protein PHU66_07255, partial [Bacteroidaceae bacterium]|nr:hypothetical protein [Bacteroidaceae bacterium]
MLCIHEELYICNQNYYKNTLIKFFDITLKQETPFYEQKAAIINHQQPDRKKSVSKQILNLLPAKYLIKKQN